MITESHICVPDRPYPSGVMACACGQFWMVAPRFMLTYMWMNRELLDRLRGYKADVQWGRADSLADAVAAAHQRSREERELARLRLAASWRKREARRHAQWKRHVWPLILSRPCAYCGGAATQVDHITPLARGGSHELRNLAAACSRCNIEKGGRTPAEWKAWRLNRGRVWPPLPVPAAA